jgi:hypothetical protein
MTTSPDPSPGRSLLKFSAPQDYALENLKNGMIFCQHYTRYNDPFEFRARILEGRPDQQAEPERFAAAVREWGFPVVDDALEFEANEYLESIEYYEPHFAGMLDGMRIACFGAERDNLLMWSHYADGLRGFCIAFDEDAMISAEPKAYLADVAYCDQPPTVDSFVYAVAYDQNEFHLMAMDEEETQIKHLGKKDDGWIAACRETADEALFRMQLIWQQIFATKPREWEYEHERRLLIQTDRDDLTPLQHSYPRHAVREIIVGERMPADYLANLKQIVAENYGHAEIRTAYRTTDSYKLQIK